MPGKSLEIELKLSLLETKKTEFMAFMASLNPISSKETELFNTYFETHDNQLRQHDAGLRIRGFNHEYEITLKTAAQGPNGLLKRDEYNYKIQTPQLDLELFPKDVWPSSINLEELKTHLKPQFTTDFMRYSWIIDIETSQGHSLIEVAFDEGHIKAGQLSENICEVELELKEGDIEGIFQFANKLLPLNSLRLSELSKAARGYRLHHCDKHAIDVDKLPFPNQSDKDEQLRDVNVLLNRLFFLEESFLRNMFDIEILIDSFKKMQLQYNAYTHSIVNQTLPLPVDLSYHKIKEFLYSEAYNHFKLMLLTHLTKI